MLNYKMLVVKANKLAWAKIGAKNDQFLPYFFPRFYRCIEAKSGFWSDLEKNRKKKEVHYEQHSVRSKKTGGGMGHGSKIHL